MPLTNPVTTTNIASTFFSDNFASVSATYYSANKPFSDFDDTANGGVILGPQRLSNVLSDVGTGVITGATIYNNLLSATTLYTNYREIIPKRGVTVTDTRLNPSTRPTSFTNYDQGLAAMPGTTTYRRPSSVVSDLASNNLTGTIYLENLNSLMTSLYNAWDTLSTTGVPTITVTVCHSSCHGSCHGSRSRR
jgi:hypothetical protein